MSHFPLGPNVQANDAPPNREQSNNSHDMDSSANFQLLNINPPPTTSVKKLTLCYCGFIASAPLVKKADSKMCGQHIYSCGAPRESSKCHFFLTENQVDTYNQLKMSQGGSANLTQLQEQVNEAVTNIRYLRQNIAALREDVMSVKGQNNQSQACLQYISEQVNTISLKMNQNQEKIVEVANALHTFIST